MAGKISPGGAVKLAQLEEVKRLVQHAYALVEQFAGARTGQESLGLTLRRQLRRLKTKLMTSGYDQMAQIAGGLEITAGRGVGVRTKVRILREGIASLKFQCDQEGLMVMREEERMRREAGEAAGED